MAGAATTSKQGHWVAHLGQLASAGAGQATAAILPTPSAVGRGRPMVAMCELTGSLFVNLPIGGRVGDEFWLYTRVGNAPVVNVSVGDAFLGTPPTLTGPTLQYFVCLEVTAGVATWTNK